MPFDTFTLQTPFTTATSPAPTNTTNTINAINAINIAATLNITPEPQPFRATFGMPFVVGRSDVVKRYTDTFTSHNVLILKKWSATQNDAFIRKAYTEFKTNKTQIFLLLKKTYLLTTTLTQRNANAPTQASTQTRNSVIQMVVTELTREIKSVDDIDTTNPVNTDTRTSTSTSTNTSTDSGPGLTQYTIELLQLLSTYKLYVKAPTQFTFHSYWRFELTDNFDDRNIYWDDIFRAALRKVVRIYFPYPTTNIDIQR